MKANLAKVADTVSGQTASLAAIPQEELPPVQAEVSRIYEGSDGTATRRLMAELEKRGAEGRLAAALFRSQKSSSRAKRYRGGDYRDFAYDRKSQQLASICMLLPDLPYEWGWGTDDACYLSDVLYIDLPCGQVSFHSADRFDGPNYRGKWDSTQSSEGNVIAFCASVLVTVEPQETVPCPRQVKEKEQFRCECCGLEKRSSLKKPKAWRLLSHTGKSFLVCSERCREKHRQNLDVQVFDEHYRLPGGKHKGEPLHAAPEDYLQWVSDNVSSETSELLQAANAELRRRFPHSTIDPA